MITVESRTGEEIEIEPLAGKGLMWSLRPLRIGVIGLCNGNAACGTCHVYIDDEWRGALQGADEYEEEMLSDLSTRTDNSRLACQIVYSRQLEGLRLRIAPDH